MPHKRAKRSVREADRSAKGVNLAPISSEAKGGDASLPKGAMRVLMGAKVRADFQDRRKERRGEGNRIGVSGAAAPDSKGKMQKQKKKKGQTSGSKADEPGRSKKADLKVLPGETLANFNRRVERTLASDINASMRAAASTSEKKSNQRKRKREDDEEEDEKNAMSKARSAEIAAARKAAEPSSADLKRAREAMVKGKGKAANEDGDEGEKDWAKADQRRRLNDVADAPPRLTRVPKLRGAAALRAAAAAAAAAAEDRPRSRSRTLAEDFEVAVPAEADYDPELDDDDDNGGSKRKAKKMASQRQSGVAKAVSRGRRLPPSSDSAVASPAMAPVRARVLAQERESAIERYRAMKEARIQQRNASAG